MANSIEFSVKHDLADIERKFRHLLNPSQIAKIATQALNRVGNTAKGDFVRRTSQLTGIKQKLIRQQLIEKRANKNNLTYWMSAEYARAINLIEFVAPNRRNPQFFRKRTKRNTAFGVGRGYKWQGVEASAWRRKKVYKGTFIIKDKSGNMAVYKRTGSDRDRITQVSGPNVKQLFKHVQWQQRLRRLMADRWNIELSRSMRIVAKRAGIDLL